MPSQLCSAQNALPGPILATQSEHVLSQLFWKQHPPRGGHSAIGTHSQGGKNDRPRGVVSPQALSHGPEEPMSELPLPTPQAPSWCLPASLPSPSPRPAAHWPHSSPMPTVLPPGMPTYLPPPSPPHPGKVITGDRLISHTRQRGL